jgi:hypothetical protein
MGELGEHIALACILDVTGLILTAICSRLRMRIQQWRSAS